MLVTKGEEREGEERERELVGMGKSRECGSEREGGVVEECVCEGKSVGLRRKQETRTRRGDYLVGIMKYY